MNTPDPAVHRTIEAVWRIERPRVIAGIARLVRDVGLAEEFAQDAFVDALVQWPASGVPPSPGAWLMSTAKHHAIDAVRRRDRYVQKLTELAGGLVEGQEPDYAGGADDEIRDDLLTLIFMSCHPVLSREARVALTLKVLGGLGTEEIARAFLVPDTTIGQRIVRAKRTLSTVEFAPPDAAAFAERLGSVLEVVYLIFNEGYAATAGAEWTRPDLCAEALRLARILAGLLPRQSEAHGLLALLELQGSRLAARVGPAGEPVLLPDQDRRRWDRLLIRRGLAALAHAEELGGAYGPYAVQAAIAACHARAASTEETDWSRIAALYLVLGKVAPSPIVELNRAVAVGRAHGPTSGLAVIDAVADDPRLRGNALVPAVRGDLLEQLGRAEEAAAEFARAGDLTRNVRERDLFQARAARLHGSSPQR